MTAAQSSVSAVLTEFAVRLASQRVEFRTEDVDEVYGSALEEVEQEREVEFQVEEVRENQKLVVYKLYKFPGLHGSILKYALESVLDEADAGAGGGYLEAYEAIGKTALG
jgi:hypothetical protein